MKLGNFHQNLEQFPNDEMNEITPEAAYVAGFIIGDGNLSTHYLVRAVEENEDFIKIFVEKFRKAFGRPPKVYFDTYNNSWVAHIHSKPIWEFLNGRLGIQSGTKSRIVRIPTPIMEARDEIKAALLSGLFDAEASVIVMKDKIHHPNGYLKIQFKIHNRNLARDVYKLLNEMQFMPRIYEYDEFSIVNLHGKSQGSMFLEKIGFVHPAKVAKLRHFLRRNKRGREFVFVARRKPQRKRV